MQLELPESYRPDDLINSPTKSIISFLDFLASSLPEGDVYLFGGVLRDLALLGGKDFNSDIDLVTEGDWDRCARYLDHLGAARNKFGGYRLIVDDWDVDIWNARETWAIKQGLVSYRGIASLTETTVLNWDGILMNWRTRSFVMREQYLGEIQERILDIVLEENPDPEGMAVRVFRHMCLKDAKSYTHKAMNYLANCTATYTLRELLNRELKSYGRSEISPDIYSYFQYLKRFEDLQPQERTRKASQQLQLDLGALPLLVSDVAHT